MNKPAFYILLTVFLASKGHSGSWVKQNSGTHETLYAVSMVDSVTAYVVGRHGTILKTTDAGIQWMPLQSGTMWDLSGVAFIDKKTGVAIGFDHLLYRTRDGGETWRADTLDGLFTSVAYRRIGTTTTLCLGDWNGRILYSTDDGVAWYSGWLGYTAPVLVDITYDESMPDGYQIFLATIHDSYYSSNYGSSWNSISNIRYSFYDRLTAGDLSKFPQFLVGLKGSLPNIFVWRRNSTDSTWQEVDHGFIPAMVLYHIQSFANSSTVYACGPKGSRYGAIVKSTDSGESWLSMLSDTVHVLNSLSFVNENNGFAVGDSGTILHYSNAATDIAPLPPEIPKNYFLYQNYPNPFNPSTTIQYDLPESSPTMLRIYNVLGEEITTLVNKFETAGSHTVHFSADQLSSGLYFYKLSTGMFTQMRKMVLTR